MSNIPYSEYSRDELIRTIERLEGEKRYGLVWEEDRVPEKVVQDCAERTPVLTQIEERRIHTHAGLPENALIEGDNYHALQVLGYTHAGAIDLIYIDPPYNTGKSNDFLYNDRYVDLSDGYRHSKWLAFMSKRLELAKGLLTETGAIFISIDDNEIAQLKLLCNAIFGEANFVAQFVRKAKTGAGHDSGQIAVEFDYMLCFAKNRSTLRFRKEALDVEGDAKYKLVDAHLAHRGKYYLRDLDYRGSYSESLDYALSAPDGTPMWAGGKAGKPNTWRWSRDKVEWGIEHDFIVFTKREIGWKVYIKQYQYVDNENKKRIRQLPYRALIQFLNAEGSAELNNMVPGNTFKFPKSTSLIRFCINLIPDKNITVLDFFAGSGTTGHAVLLQNALDGGKRRFVLCTNNENLICETVTYPRLQAAISGYQNLRGKWVEGCGGNLRYFAAGYLGARQSLFRECAALLWFREGCAATVASGQGWVVYSGIERFVAVADGTDPDGWPGFATTLEGLTTEAWLYTVLPTGALPPVQTLPSNAVPKPLPTGIDQWLAAAHTHHG